MTHLFDRLRITRRRAIAAMGAGMAALLAGCGLTPKPVSPALLQRRVQGRVVTRGDADYERTRASLVYNTRVASRRPEMIVRAADVDDVIAAVHFAREHKLKIAVRCGGHHWAMPTLRNGGVLIDVAALKEVVVHHDARTAIVGPGVRNAELAEILGEHGLAFPYGHSPSVAMGGYLLGGGFGWNMGQWGVACSNVVGVEVVTAEGELIHASEHDHADLYWAARGAGPGFFGVITAYHVKLYPLPGAIRTSTLIFSIEDAPRVADWFVDVSRRVPVNVELTMIFAAPPPDLPGDHAHVCIVMANAFAPDAEQADRVLEPIADCPLDALLRVMNVTTPFNALFAMIERALPEGPRYRVDTHWFDEDLPRVLAAAAEQVRLAPSPRSLMLCVPMSEAMRKRTPDAAFSMIAPLYVAVYAAWDDAGDDAANLTWLRRATGVLDTWTVGRYVGEADLTADAAHTRACYAHDAWDRLAAIRRRYDPRSVFHGPMSH